MSTATKIASIGKTEGIPPRERILAVACDLFYRHGIKAVGVESVAEAAGTNKMTLYRHFASKDELVAEYLRRLADKASSSWDKLAAAHPGNPRAQLRAWLEDMAGGLAPARRGGGARGARRPARPGKEKDAPRAQGEVQWRDHNPGLQLRGAARAGRAGA